MAVLACAGPCTGNPTFSLAFNVSIAPAVAPLADNVNVAVACSPCCYLLTLLPWPPVQEAGVPMKLARSIGIAVDHRRRNRSLESLQVQCPPGFAVGSPGIAALAC